ncbi:MAG: helix-turn-helix transcriptional regulator [Muribaculaceae bacterium]|nr:helix-turn-helix transcriptional regulator [Muribaculaceae bacterium]
MRDKHGVYRVVDNSTQLIRLSPHGKIWLILCTYRLSSHKDAGDGIASNILNTKTGEIDSLSFGSRRAEILSTREKEVLMLIRDGKPSKQIADILGISIHTVNRHRQNIIEKLSVGNSVEAVTAATLMKLL